MFTGQWLTYHSAQRVHLHYMDTISQNSAFFHYEIILSKWHKSPEKTISHMKLCPHTIAWETFPPTISRHVGGQIAFTDDTSLLSDRETPFSHISKEKFRHQNIFWFMKGYGSNVWKLNPTVLALDIWIDKCFVLPRWYQNSH